MKIVQILLCYGLLLAMCFELNEARPSSAGEAGAVSTEWTPTSHIVLYSINCQDTDGLETPDAEEVRAAYGGYEMPAQAIYPNIPMDRLQMLFAQYRPTLDLASYLILFHSYLPYQLFLSATVPTYAHRPMATWMNCIACPRASVKCGTDSATSIPSPASGSKFP